MATSFNTRMQEVMGANNAPPVDVEPSKEVNEAVIQEEMVASASWLDEFLDEEEEQLNADGSASIPITASYHVGDTEVIATPIGDIPYGTRKIVEFQIEDTSGKFKNKLLDIVSRTGAYIIPASIGDIPPQVVNIKDFEILEFGGIKYYCSSMGKASEVDLRDYCDMVIASLKRSGSFSGTLMYRVHGFDFNTLRFGKQDLSSILATFSGWKVQIVAKGEDLYLMVD